MTNILHHRRHSVVVEFGVVQSQSARKRRNPQRSHGIKHADEPHWWLRRRLSVGNRIAYQRPGVVLSKTERVRGVRSVVGITGLVQVIRFRTKLTSLVIIETQGVAIDDAVVIDQAGHRADSECPAAETEHPDLMPGSVMI